MIAADAALFVVLGGVIIFAAGAFTAYLVMEGPMSRRRYSYLHGCSLDCTPTDPCEHCEAIAEDSVDPYLGYTPGDLEVMADYAAAREFGGGRR